MKNQNRHSWRKRLLYVLLGLAILCLTGGFAAWHYAKAQFFADQPNTLELEADIPSVPFVWSEETFGDYTEPYNAVLLPVTIPGFDTQFHMQFDTGSPSTFLRSEAIAALAERGLEFEMKLVDGEARVKQFAVTLGGASVLLNSGKVNQRGVDINWEDSNAINLIGTFGADLLDQKVCQIDFPARLLRLHKRRSEELDSLGRFTPLRFKGRRIMLPTKIDDVEMEVFYDSGCSAFGLLTSKYHFNRYADETNEQIIYNANRHGDPINIHHKPCGLVARFGDTDLPIERVSYAELYTLAQETVGRLVSGGFFGNRSLLKSTLIIDTIADEFLIVNKTLAMNSEMVGAQSSTEVNRLFQIPFTLTEHNNISIDVVLDGKHKLVLMFHTGNSDVCLTATATRKLAGLSFEQTGNVKSWGGESEARFSGGHSLQIGSCVWDGITLFEDELSGRGTDGKFGPDLFKGKVVEIDFDRQMLVVHETLPKVAASYQRFECRQYRNSMFIKGRLQVDGDILPNEFMIHSGFGGTVLLDDEFVSRNNLNQLEAISESELRDSFGNVVKTKKVLLPLLSFGDSSFTNIPIGFFDGAIGRQKMSIVGGDVLKRFNLILNSDRSCVYMKANSLFDKEFGS